MATTPDDGDATAADADDRTRPRFRGCVLCYGAQLLAYGVRTLRR